jgi:hypothetical protein
MNSKFLLCIFFFCFIASHPIENNLSIMIESLQTIKPPLANNLVKNIQSSGSVKADAFDVSDLNTRFASKYHDLPEEIENKFKAITLVDSIEYETFLFEYKTPQGSLIEYVGAARRDGSLVQIAWITCSSKGDVIQPVTLVQQRKCKSKMLFWKKCKNVEKQVPRGLNLDELNIVEQTIRADAYDYLKRNFSGLVNNMNIILDSAIENNKSKKGFLVLL